MANQAIRAVSIPMPSIPGRFLPLRSHAGFTPKDSWNVRLTIRDEQK